MITGCRKAVNVFIFLDTKGALRIHKETWMTDEAISHRDLHEHLRTTVAMAFIHDTRDEYGNDWVDIDEVEVAVAYLTEVDGRLPEINIISVGCSLDAEGSLCLGGTHNTRFHKNLAIGRRTCPDCRNSGQKGYIIDSGDDAGNCMNCGKPSDYIVTAIDTSFRYYDNGDCDSNHVIFNTREQLIADVLKVNWPVGAPTELILPHTPGECNGTTFVNCAGIQLNDVKLFSRDKYDLTGTVTGTVYDFSV